MTEPDLEEIEVDLLLQALLRRFGYDFQDYSRASLLRRLREYARRTGFGSIAELIPALLHDPQQLDPLINGISVSVTEPFRDPEALSAVSRHVIPWLRSFAFAKIWIAGCATGEEAYSLAVLLDEAGLLGRVQIYATDINTDALNIAKQAVYSVQHLEDAQENYLKAGGKGKLSDHYVAQYGHAKMADHLVQRIVFSQHNLATDSHFGEMQFVICRNVLIYFDKPLQNRVLSLFRKCLCHRGFLSLGARESMRWLEAGRMFDVIDEPARLFRAI